MKLNRLEMKHANGRIKSRPFTFCFPLQVKEVNGQQICSGLTTGLPIPPQKKTALETSSQQSLKTEPATPCTCVGSPCQQASLRLPWKHFPGWLQTEMIKSKTLRNHCKSKCRYRQFYLSLKPQSKQWVRWRCIWRNLKTWAVEGTGGSVVFVQWYSHWYIAIFPVNNTPPPFNTCSCSYHN